MVIFGIDAGLTAPGFAVVETTDNTPAGNVLLAECFIPTAVKDAGGKVMKVRKTDFDAHRIRQIITRMFDIADQYKPDAIVAELPTGGAKSGGAIRGMAFSTSMTVTFTTAVQRYAAPTIPSWPKTVQYITPIENKKGSTGKVKWDVDPEQGKWEVFNAVRQIWPNGITWPRKKRNPTELDDGLCWAMADALSCVATYLRRRGAITKVF